MTAADLRSLAAIQRAAAQLAADCESIRRKPQLVADADRLSLALGALKLAQRETLWAFATPRAGRGEAPGVKDGCACTPGNYLDDCPQHGSGVNIVPR